MFRPGDTAPPWRFRRSRPRRGPCPPPAGSIVATTADGWSEKGSPREGRVSGSTGEQEREADRTRPAISWARVLSAESRFSWPPRLTGHRGRFLPALVRPWLRRAAPPRWRASRSIEVLAVIELVDQPQVRLRAGYGGRREPRWPAPPPPGSASRRPGRRRPAPPRARRRRARTPRTSCGPEPVAEAGLLAHVLDERRIRGHALTLLRSPSRRCPGRKSLEPGNTPRSSVSRPVGASRTEGSNGGRAVGSPSGVRGDQAGKELSRFGPACSTSGGQPLAKSLKFSR